MVWTCIGMGQPDRKHSRALKRSFMDESQVVLEKRREKF